VDWRDLARSQAGVISLDQLRASGLTDGETRGLRTRGDLVRLLPGVYAARPVRDSFERRVWAAALWSGGVVSHRSAARLWDLPVKHSATIDITVTRELHRSAPSVRLHRRSVEPPASNLDGLRVATRQVTVVDLLRSDPFRSARDLFDRAIQQGWVDLDFLERAVHDGRGLAGNAQLRRLVSLAEPGAHAESERLLHRLLRRSGISGWKPQHPIRLSDGWAEADVAFPEYRLVIEIDGKRYHDERSGRFESDRERGNDLQLLGWRVLRITWRMLIDDPDKVVAKIKAALAS
jgi:very-short-patch-repair endonuclease